MIQSIKEGHMIKSILLNGDALDTRYRKEKAQKAAQEMLRIFQSNMFKKMWLEMPDEWRLGESSEMKTWSNEDIYAHIMSGKEEWNDIVDYEIDLIVADYYSFARVIGYMNPGRPTVYVNTKYFDKATRKSVGSNFAHEYLHTLGSRHSGRNLRSSLPYYMNKVYGECYDRLIRDGLRDIDYDGNIATESPTTPVPENKDYKVVCKRVWYKLWLGKTCYRVYDI